MTQLEALQKHLTIYKTDQDLNKFVEDVKSDEECESEFGCPLLVGEENGKKYLDVVEGEDNVLARILLSDVQYTNLSEDPIIGQF